MKNFLLLLAVIVMSAVPLLFVKNGFPHSDIFTGSDSQAEEFITVTHPEYKPWFKPFFEAPSPEIENLLFAVQASAGALIIGYVLGYYKGISRKKNRHDTPD